jgi:hypothetical protein
VLVPTRIMSSSKVSQSHSLISGGLPPSSSAEISVNKNGTSYCSQCKRQISADQPWKRCLSCREKNRGYRKRAAARAALANLEIPNDDHAQLLVNGKRKERTDDTSDRLGGMKKKMRKVFQDKPSAKSTVPSLSVGHFMRRLLSLVDGYHYRMGRATPVTRHTGLQRICTKHSKAAARPP